MTSNKAPPPAHFCAKWTFASRPRWRRRRPNNSNDSKWRKTTFGPDGNFNSSFPLGRLARQSILHNTNFLSPLPSCIRRGNNEDGNNKHPITTPLPPLARCELPSSQGVAHNALWDNRGSVEPSHLARQRFVPPSLLRVLFLLHLIDAVGISSTEEEEISRFIDRGIK